ncbi:MAG TPA: hypothetical protein VIJ40_08875 [Acidimicrobiales bacterium]
MAGASSDLADVADGTALLVFVRPEQIIIDNVIADAPPTAHVVHTEF